MCESKGITDAGADGAFRGAPKQVNAGNMDDGPKRQLASGGFDCAAEGNGAFAGNFTKGSVAGAAFDGARHALRQQQPPRNNVAVPGVDDDLYVLVEEVAVNDFDLHIGQTAVWRR